MNQQYIPEFLDMNGLEDYQEKELLMHLSSVNTNPNVKFPWDFYEENKRNVIKGSGSYLNAFAPSFKSSVYTPISCETDKVQWTKAPSPNNCSNNIYCSQYSSSGNIELSNISNFTLPNHEYQTKFKPMSSITSEINGNFPHSDYSHNVCISKVSSMQLNFISNEMKPAVKEEILQNNEHDMAQRLNDRTLAVTYDVRAESDFKLDPTVSVFVPKTVGSYSNNEFVDAELTCNVTTESFGARKSSVTAKVGDFIETDNASETNDNNVVQRSKNTVASCSESSAEENFEKVASPSHVEVNSVAAPPRSWADVLKSKAGKSTIVQPVCEQVTVQPNENCGASRTNANEDKKANVDDDKLAIELGRHLMQCKLDLTNISLQPRGLINRSNWCYINATLQALLACSPFYSLLRNLPIGVGVERGPSSTPVIDSMVKLSYEFIQLKEDEEELNLGVPFQPVTVYQMLGTLKSHCLKGLQEDAEEFLSFILNGMHEEMAGVIKSYEKQYNMISIEEMKAVGNDELSDGEEEWQVIGAKKRAMVTRKVIEHKTPISDLLGGQIKSLLTINGNKTSASVQPFFTLQLDIQSENVTSVEEALDQLTVKEPIQGYTCTKTKQEVEAFCHIMLEKLPPVLILHLKRFIYNRNGGCKKIIKHTEYPILLELKKELFSPEAKKGKRHFTYKLFAVMYHDGVEALIGHYIADIYHHVTKSWIRCDDRNIIPITEAQVLSHSPPRVPYLLFYQVCDQVQEKN